MQSQKGCDNELSLLAPNVVRAQTQNIFNPHPWEPTFRGVGVVPLLVMSRLLRTRYAASTLDKESTQKRLRQGLYTDREETKRRSSAPRKRACRSSNFCFYTNSKYFVPEKTGCSTEGVKAGPISRKIIKKKKIVSCEIEDFVNTHFGKLCVILRLYALYIIRVRFLCT